MIRVIEAGETWNDVYKPELRTFTCPTCMAIFVTDEYSPVKTPKRGYGTICPCCRDHIVTNYAHTPKVTMGAALDYKETMEAIMMDEAEHAANVAD